MAATIICPKCGLQGQVSDGFQGPQTQCPRCNTVIAVAALAAAPSAPPEPKSANGHRDSFTQTLDQFFAAAFNPPPRHLGPAPVSPFAVGAMAPLEMPSRPPPDPDADPRVEREWLREEHERLQAYMRRHFAVLQQQRQEFDGWRSQVEAALMGREQELSLQKKILASQQETLQQREAAPLDHPKPPGQELSPLRQTAEQVQQEIAAQQARLGELRKATANVKADYLALENAVRSRKQKSEQEQAEVREPRQPLTATSSLTAPAAQSLAQRECELQALERQIHSELERQEQDLARERRELQEWRDQVVQESCEKDILRRKVGTLARELEQLRRRAGNAPDIPR